MTCSGHTTLDGGALRRAPLRLLDLESLCSGRSDQSDWLYQVRPRSESLNVVTLSLHITRLAHSAEVYNLHGAKRLVTITNVLSASCPSVNQDGENKPFLHIDCFT